MLSQILCLGYYTKKNKNMKESKTQQQLALGKQNLIFLAIGVLVIFIGFALMMGSSSGVEFNPDIFSSRRITLAPMVILGGFLFVIFAILWKTKTKNEEDKK